MFFATILAKPKNYIGTVLKVNDEVKLRLYSGDGKYYGSGSNLLVSHLNKGDKVKMTTYCCGSNLFIYTIIGAPFQGSLLRPMNIDFLVSQIRRQMNWLPFWRV